MNGEQAERGLEQGGIDDAALARLFALQQPADAAERRPHAGAEIEHGGADAHARPIGIAIDGKQSGEGLHHRFVAGVFLHGAGRAPKADRLQ